MGMAAAVALLALIGIVTLVRNADDTADVASGVDDVPLTELANRAAKPARPRSTARPVPLPLEHRGSVVRRDRRARRQVRASSCPSCGSIATERACVGSTSRGGHRPHLVHRKAPSPPSHATSRCSQLNRSSTRRSPTASSARSPPIPKRCTPSARRTGGDPTTPPSTRRHSRGGSRSRQRHRRCGRRPSRRSPNSAPSRSARVTTYNGQDGFGYQGAGEGGAPWIIVIDAASTRVLGLRARRREPATPSGPTQRGSTSTANSGSSTRSRADADHDKQIQAGKSGGKQDGGQAERNSVWLPRSRRYRWSRRCPSTRRANPSSA